MTEYSADYFCDCYSPLANATIRTFISNSSLRSLKLRHWSNQNHVLHLVIIEAAKLVANTKGCPKLTEPLWRIAQGVELFSDIDRVGISPVHTIRSHTTRIAPSDEGGRIKHLGTHLDLLIHPSGKTHMKACWRHRNA